MYLCIKKPRLRNSIEIDISDTCNPESIVIKYSIKNKYINNTLGSYADYKELRGIKRLNVFKFNV